MVSVDHPDVPPPEKGYTRISLDVSGFVLSPYPGPSEWYQWQHIFYLITDGSVHTTMTIVCQVAFGGAMHKMLKGAYNSGNL